MNFATLNYENCRSVRCPYIERCNLEFHAPERIKGRLFQNGFLPRYVVGTNIERLSQMQPLQID